MAFETIRPDAMTGGIEIDEKEKDKDLVWQFSKNKMQGT